MATRPGLYRALVVNNADPLGKGRLQLSCAQLWGTATTDWAEGVQPLPILDTNATGESGSLLPPLPSIGMQVWIGFQAGDENYPVWLGVAS